MNTALAKNNKQISNLKIRKDILEIESMLMQVPGAVLGDSDLCPLKHSFSDGIYVREMFIPKGVVLTGKIHKHEHPYFVLKGSVTVVNEFEGKKVIKAPSSTISKAGTKRLIIANEDTILVTVHHNPGNLRDLKKLEDLIVSSNFEDYQKHLKQLSSGNHSKNCGLEALKKMSSLKKTSMRSLIDLAEDNGMTLYPYAIVDGEQLMTIPFPAIVHSENHFDYISKKEDFDFNKEYTGYVLLTKESDYKKIKSSELKNIIGETFTLVAAGSLTALGYAAVTIGAAVAGSSITAAANSKTKCGSECRAICKKETGAIFGGRKECKRKCKEKCVNAATDLQKVEELKEIAREEEAEKKVTTLYIVGGILFAVALGLALWVVFRKKK